MLSQDSSLNTDVFDAVSVHAVVAPFGPVVPAASVGAAVDGS